MNPGKLRHRLILQGRTFTQDSYGQPQPTWVTSGTNCATVWGSVEPLRGKELLTAQQLESNVTHRVRIRYNATIDATWRVTHDSRTLEVVSVVNPDEYNAELELMCEEKT